MLILSPSSYIAAGVSDRSVEAPAAVKLRVLELLAKEFRAIGNTYVQTESAQQREIHTDYESACGLSPLSPHPPHLSSL
jgi:hypothetical protein